MAFWKQSGDPWDRKPDKRPTEPREPKENPVDTLKSWNEQRKSAAREKEDAKRLPPEKCPWCGKDMEQGYLQGGRDSVWWHSGVYKFDFFRGISGDSSNINILDDGSVFASYKITWFCRDCKKMVFNAPDLMDGSAAGSIDEMEQEEKSEE